MNIIPMARKIIPFKRKAENPLSRLLVLGGLATLADAREDIFPVLVELELADDNLRGGDGDRDALAIGLFPGNTLDMDGPLETVNGCDLPLTSLVGSSHDRDLVVFADGNGADLFPTHNVVSKSRSNRGGCVVAIVRSVRREKKTLSCQTQAKIINSH